MCKHIWTNVCPSITGVYCDWCFYVVLKIISLMWQGRALRWEGTDIILTSCICAFASYALYNPPLDRGKLHVGVTITAQSVASDPCFNVDLTTQSFPPHWEEQRHGFLTISRLIKGVTCYCPLTTLGFYSIYAAWSSLDRYHAYHTCEGTRLHYRTGRYNILPTPGPRWQPHALWLQINCFPKFYNHFFCCKRRWPMTNQQWKKAMLSSRANPKFFLYMVLGWRSSIATRQSDWQTIHSFTPCCLNYLSRTSALTIRHDCTHKSPDVQLRT